ncbi:MAG TPA: glucose-1-phosphate adenylyltransferase [Candidatus Bathyarchaeia archaeon]|nr:glucose-1-phosphate adenylyltransferase [Candidatus Bathyarchaeia archaeon]
MRDVVALILGGGRGTRLFPLTKTRSKPAVPLAGNYRLIDVTVSNCINSKIDRIYVLTQFNSASLNQHISKTYRFDTFSSGFVEVFAAEQTPSSLDWFQGTGDAVRKVLPYVANFDPRDVIILSGDHLYRMDYVDFIARHRFLDSEITIAVKPVPPNRAPELGILRADGRGRIIEFREKPKGKLLTDMRTNTKTLGLPATQAKHRPYLGSMGVYLFKFDVLKDVLERDPRMIDFAKEIIPDALTRLKVHSYLFDGYWEDIGTIPTFYRAHMELVAPLPPFNLFDERQPLYTHYRFLPGPKVNEGRIDQSILNSGCIIEHATIKRSIIGVRERIGAGTVIEDSIVMGADFYELPWETGERLPLGIGRRCIVRKAIIDKNARIGNRVSLVNKKGLENYDDPRERYYIRSGIIVVPKGASIADGTEV